MSFMFDAVGHRIEETKKQRIPLKREEPRKSAKFPVSQDSSVIVWLDNFINAKKIKYTII